MSTKLVLIEPKSKTYTVFEGRNQVAKFKSEALLYPNEVEELRIDQWDGEDPDGDLVA